MKLNQLYENFGEATPERQREIIAAYRFRRAEDMFRPSAYKKKTPSTRVKIELTEQEAFVAKVLGLKPKDIIALRTTVTPEEENDTVADNAADLFKDSTYEGEDEDE